MQLGMLVWPPRRAYRRHKQPLRVLDRLEPHAASCRLDDEYASCMQPSTLYRHMRRAPRDRQGARLLESKRRKLVCEERRGSARFTCERGVANAKGGGTKGFHFPCR